MPTEFENRFRIVEDADSSAEWFDARIALPKDQETVMVAFMSEDRVRIGTFVYDEAGGQFIWPTQGYLLQSNALYWRRR